MGILNRLLSRSSGLPEYSDQNELRTIWDNYCNNWPDNVKRYGCWKPTSVLPAPKWAVKQAIKLCYAEWPMPIDWTDFAPFFMEFVDLALHLPQEKYNVIDNFRKQRIICNGKENKTDPLSTFKLCSNLAVSSTTEYLNQDIVRIRDGLRRSTRWDPVDVDDYELDAVRRILLECTVDFATLVEEWRFYILSIGRDQYIAKT